MISSQIFFCFFFFKLLLHDSKEIPQIYEKGVKLSPGFEYFITSKKKSINLLPYPHGNCKNEPNYRISNCYHECLSDYVAEKCNCVDIDMKRSYF